MTGIPYCSYLFQRKVSTFTMIWNPDNAHNLGSHVLKQKASQARYNLTRFFTLADTVSKLAMVPVNLILVEEF